MKTNALKAIIVAGTALGLVSCGNITREDTGQVAGTIGGGALGYAVGDDDSEKALYAAGGAALGGLATSHFLGNKDFEKGVKEGKEVGYDEGQADSAKRMYWVLQAAQNGSRTHGQVSMREIELAPTLTEDGRFLMARKVTMPIVDPSN